MPPKTIVAFAGVAEPVSVPSLFAGQIICAHVQGPKAHELEEVENQNIHKYLLNSLVFFSIPYHKIWQDGICKITWGDLNFAVSKVSKVPTAWSGGGDASGQRNLPETMDWIAEAVWRSWDVMSICQEMIWNATSWLCNSLYLFCWQICVLFSIAFNG